MSESMFRRVSHENTQIQKHINTQIHKYTNTVYRLSDLILWISHSCIETPLPRMAGFLNGSFNPKDSRDTILTVAHLRWVELELCHTYPLPCSLQEVILHRMRLAGKHLHTYKNKKQHEHLNFKDTKIICHCC